MILELPMIYLLPTNLESEELHDLEEQIPTLTYDINEAEIVLGKITKKQRALFELRKLKLTTEEVDLMSEKRSPSPSSSTSRPTKTVRISTVSDGGSSDIDSDTASEAEIQRRLVGPFCSSSSESTTTIKVVKLTWLTDCLKAKTVLPLADYIIYEGRRVAKPTSPPPPPPPSNNNENNNILQRALKDAAPSSSNPHKRSYYSSSTTTSSHSHKRTSHHHPPQLLHQTTSENDLSLSLPPIPPFLHSTYSCQRPTPSNPPNLPFINQLLKIRTARTLLSDKIGVRAYSSAIATIAAYPFQFQTPQEVSRLPGCGDKIALLFQEYKENGYCDEAKSDENDPRLKTLKKFYDIWGVGEHTALEFYNKGWRDIDDVIEFGWDSLSRVQQIGVKYYEEFLVGIPRKEVERIANKILDCAGKNWEMVIVGGHRRGKLESGDVDVVLSHRDERQTKNAIERIVVRLEEKGYITHTLLISTANSERGQVPVSWKGETHKGSRTGFDTLDKALVVWKEGELHRRVDIIISPWKTCGCAVLGWTSGTTFQRDLRRFCKKERDLKFDSSGVRSRKDGRWVDLESDEETGKQAPDMLAAEKRVFEGIGLEWREPGERCTF
ncbi:putative DNA polymerase [Podospora fimiseda]|uniref:DNA polymerase n=1 Tax=Podospora fimiseda TaxID=252190 RepID=A0AAN7BRM0_9PEZI|nr:putative DNA polymerase [Podospora fimiseda]